MPDFNFTNNDLHAWIDTAYRQKLAQELSNPHRWLTQQQEHLHGKRNRSGAIETDNQTVWVKLISSNRWGSLAGKLDRAWTAATALSQSGIRTPSCLVAAELRRPWHGMKGLLVSEFCTNSQTVNNWLEENDPNDHLAMIESLARFLRHFHDKGFRHRDLRFRNILCPVDGIRNDKDFILVDINRLRRYKQLTAMDRVRDIERLFLAEQQLSAFYRQYADTPEQADDLTRVALDRLAFWKRLKKHSPYSGKTLTRLWYYYWEFRCYRAPVSLLANSHSE